MERIQSVGSKTNGSEMKGRIGHRRSPSLLGGVLRALLFSYAFAALLLLLLSLLLSRLGDPTSYIGLLSVLSVASSAALGGFLTERKTKGGILLPSLMFSLCFCLISGALTLLLNGGRLPIGAFLLYAVATAAALLGAFLGRREKPKKKKHKRR